MWPYLAIYLVVLLGLCVGFVRRQHSDWDSVFVPTSAHLLAGNDLYHQPHGFTYPPFQSLLAVPIVHAPGWLSRFYWFTINAFCLSWALHSCWRLLGTHKLAETDKDTPGTTSDSRRRRKLFWIAGFGLMVSLPFCLNSLSHQQSDLVMLAFLMFGCERLAQQRALQAAVGFGLAAAMKCTPLLFVPYLLVRGRFLAALAVLAVALGANLLPDLIQRSTQNATWLGQWYEMYVAPMTRSDYTPGVWASEIIYNQSLIGATNRWTHTRWQIEGRKVQIKSIPPAYTPSDLKKILLSLVLICGSVGLVSVWYPASKVEPHRTAWECSIVIAGMLLFSPMSSPAHFGVLLLPALLLARGLVQNQQYRLIAPASVLLLGALAINKDLLGGVLHTLGLWYGVSMWAAIAALCGSVLGRIADTHSLSVTTTAAPTNALPKAA